MADSNCLQDSIDQLRAAIERHSLWIAEHDGRINVLWEQQLKLNATLVSRVGTLEKRVVWLTGLAAAGGAAVTNFIPALGG